MSWIKRLLGQKDAKTSLRPKPPSSAPTGTTLDNSETDSPSILTGLSTDVASILIFHPNDLEHAESWPIAWYAEPAVWQNESREGRLIGWSTRSDGGFGVQMRAGPLTPREAASSVQSWTFPYTVRHGRVFLDNSDCLPGQEQMEQAGDFPSRWLSLDNGDYLVTVHGLNWQAAPAAPANDEAALPDYVVSFLPRNADDIPTIAQRPPDLTGQPGSAPSDKIHHSYTPPEDKPPMFQTIRGDLIDMDQVMPAGIAKNLSSVGNSFTSEGESPLRAATEDGTKARDSFRLPYIMAGKIEVGALGQLCRLHGARGAPGKPSRFDLTAKGPVRVTQVLGGYHNGEVVPLNDLEIGDHTALLYAVRAEPVYTPHGDYSHIDVADLRASIAQSLTSGALQKADPGLALYRRCLVLGMTHVVEMTDFMTTFLPMDTEARQQLGLLSIADRIDWLKPLL